MGKLFALFVGLALVEVSIFNGISAYLGHPPWAWGLLIGSALAGLLMVLHGGRQRRALDRAGGSRYRSLDPLGWLIAGVLLMVPGILSDAAGVLLLVGAPRRWVAGWFLRYVEGMTVAGRPAGWHVADDEAAKPGNGADRYDNVGRAAPRDSGETKPADEPLVAPRDVRDADFEFLE